MLWLSFPPGLEADLENERRAEVREPLNNDETYGLPEIAFTTLILARQLIRAAD
jgi:hypothetical protein